MVVIIDTMKHFIDLHHISSYPSVPFPIVSYHSLHEFSKQQQHTPNWIYEIIQIYQL